MRKLICLLCLFLGLIPMAKADSTQLYMVNVGKGDAIIIMHGGKNWLIDTGKAEAWEKLEAALKDMGIDRLEGVFMTHTDKDHSGGLRKLAKSKIKVGAWYAAALCPEDRSENPITKAASKAKPKAEVTWLSAGDCVDEIFTVIGPVYSNEYKEDNNSLVMMLETDYGRVLLTGDMEIAEEIDIVNSGADLRCDVFKVPNHADNDVCKAGLIDETGASVALISTDSYDKPGTPDDMLVYRLKNLGMEVYCTDDIDAAGILVTMDKNGITVTEK